MGGGSVGGHGLVLAMHLLKEQQSFTKFHQLLTENFSHLCDCINCLQPFNKALSQVGSNMHIVGCNLGIWGELEHAARSFNGESSLEIAVVSILLLQLQLQAPSPPKPEAVLTVDLGTEFQVLYQRVVTAMNNIQYSHGTPAKTKELTKIMDEWYVIDAKLH